MEEVELKGVENDGARFVRSVLRHLGVVHVPVASSEILGS